MYNFYYLSWALFSALISVYLIGMGFKASEVSLVVSASFLTSLITQPIIGKWNDQYNLKKVNTILFVIAIVGGLVFMFGPLSAAGRPLRVPIFSRCWYGLCSCRQ